jgi:hypothetical protein
VPFKPFTFYFSPLTQFQRTGAQVAPGQILAFKKNETGPLFLIEKLYRLDVRPSFLAENAKREGSTFSLGAWYWTHGSKSDRYSVYGKYFFNGRYGAQLSIGGDRNVGLIEYYGFFLYNVLRPHGKSPLAVQAGVGPYFPRQELGSPGYTYTLAAAYNLGPDLSVIGSLWYLNFKSKFPPFGFTKSSTTARYSIGVGYSF